jgi:hypothetical protein
MIPPLLLGFLDDAVIPIVAKFLLLEFAGIPAVSDVSG